MALPLLPLASIGLGAGANIYNAIEANKDRKSAQRSLNALSSQPFERYSVNPAISRYYQTASTQAANPYGYSQAERGAFNQDLNSSLGAQNYYATNMSGGNLGKALNFFDNSSRLRALNDFASRDASLRRSYQNDALGRQFQAAGVMQNVDNMNIQSMLARRMQALQGYGAAVQSNKDFVRNTIGGIGRDLLTAGFMGSNMSNTGSYGIPQTGYIQTPTGDSPAAGNQFFGGDILRDIGTRDYNPDLGLMRPMNYGRRY